MRQFVMLGLVLSATMFSKWALAEWDVEMSAYNYCESGGDESKWGDKRLKPSQYMLDKNPGVAMIAVSKIGGTNAMRGMCFRATGGEPDGSRKSRSMMEKIRSVLFVAADECADCSNKSRVDVSTSCNSGLSDNMLVSHIKLHEEPCPKDIQDKMKGYDKVAAVPPSAKRTRRRATSTR